MGSTTTIPWCDSTVNPSAGCDGCELWREGDEGEICYAGRLVNDRFRHKGRGVWPAEFTQPEIYPHRIVRACSWSDLSGTDRPKKRWLDGHPRTVFVGDMGDTYTENLDDSDYLRRLVAKSEGSPHHDLFQQALAAVEGGGHWLDPWVPAMAAAPHIWMMLTKRPARMRKAFEHIGGVPKNFWPMTSVTSQKNVSRIEHLLKIPGASVYGVSIEPLLGRIDIAPFLVERTHVDCDDEDRDRLSKWLTGDGDAPFVTARVSVRPALDWIIVGGASGRQGPVCDVAIIREIVETSSGTSAKLFVKQLGRRTRMSFREASWALSQGGRFRPDPPGTTAVVVTFTDMKGEDPEEWPPDLRLRQMPERTSQSQGEQRS